MCCNKERVKYVFFFNLQTLYKTQVKELKEELEEKNKETQKKIQELQNEK